MLIFHSFSRGERVCQGGHGGLLGITILNRLVSYFSVYCVGLLSVAEGLSIGGGGGASSSRQERSHLQTALLAAMLLTIKQCFLAILSPIWKLIGVCLVVFSLLIVGCGGGGGGGGSSSGGSGPDNIIMVDTGGGANGTGPAKAQWAILAQTNLDGDEEIAIRWHNVKSFESAGARRFSVEYTVDGQEMEPYSRALSAFTDLYNTINATGLIGEAGEVHKFGPNITVTYANGTVYTLPIEWGTDPDFTPFVDEHGSDGVAIPSDVPLVVVDPGGSVCRITDDAADCDGDGLNNTGDACPSGQSGWTWAMGGNTDDDDGDGCHNDEDIDDDGDGLIEISTAEELNAVRYQLDGTGRKESDTASLNRTGCGGKDGRDKCNGYELTQDIDLTSFISSLSDGKGWLPIAHDTTSSQNGCQGRGFTGIFDGDDFEVSGLFINRPDEDCIGLFGLVGTGGSIRNLGVIATSITGDRFVGSLAGQVQRSGPASSIIQSYGLSNQVTGRNTVGGLIGDASGGIIIRSYAVSDTVRGNHTRESFVGGLLGASRAGQNTDGATVDALIVQSYAVTKILDGGIGGYVGGLVGSSDGSIVQSYAVSGLVRSSNFGGIIGGLVGGAGAARIVQSYAVSESIQASHRAMGGLVGAASNMLQVIDSYAVTGGIIATGSPFRAGISGLVSNSQATAQASYWDSNTSKADGRVIEPTTESMGAESKTTDELRSPITFTGIYAAWDDRDGSTIAWLQPSIISDQGTAALNSAGTMWCDEDLSGTIETDEQRNNDNRVWDLGTNMQYPAIRCTPGSLAEQRDWWSLNATHKPELDRDLLDDWLDGSPP